MPYSNKLIDAGYMSTVILLAYSVSVLVEMKIEYYYYRKYHADP